MITKILLIIGLIFIIQNLKAQNIEFSKHQVSIKDTSCFYNKQLLLVATTKKKKIELSEIVIDTTKTSKSWIQINSEKYRYENTISEFNVKVSHDTYSSEPDYSWSLSIDMGNSYESFTLKAVYCNNQYVIFDVVGVKKKGRRSDKYGYLYTVIYKIN